MALKFRFANFNSLQNPKTFLWLFANEYIDEYLWVRIRMNNYESPIIFWCCDMFTFHMGFTRLLENRTFWRISNKKLWNIWAETKQPIQMVQQRIRLNVWQQVNRKISVLSIEFELFLFRTWHWSKYHVNLNFLSLSNNFQWKFENWLNWTSFDHFDLNTNSKRSLAFEKLTWWSFRPLKIVFDLTTTDLDGEKKVYKSRCFRVHYEPHIVTLLRHNRENSELLSVFNTYVEGLLFFSGTKLL